MVRYILEYLIIFLMFIAINSIIVSCRNKKIELQKEPKIVKNEDTDLEFNNKNEERQKARLKQILKKSSEKNKEHYMTLCEQEEDDYACYSAARLLCDGIDYLPDSTNPAYDYYIKAREYAEMHCEFNEVDSCFLSAELWGMGYGGEKDPEKSLEFKKQAIYLADTYCENGDAFACWSLAIYWNNIGVFLSDENIEYIRSLYYKKACKFKRNSEFCKNVKE